MRFFLLVVTLLACLITGTVKAAENTTVSFYTWRVQDAAFWQVINDQGLIPGITIDAKAIYRELYEPFIKLQLQNNNVDFFLWKPGASNLKELIEHDFIAPYEQDLSMMNSSAMVAAKGHDGLYYGVPFAIQLQSIIVNKKLLQKNGIHSAPNSMSELTAAFDKLSAAGINPVHVAGGANWYVTQVLAEVLVAGLVRESFAQGLIDGERCFTEPEYRKIFEVMSSWVKSGYTNADIASADYAVMSKAVGIGNSAMSIEGGWMIGPTSVFYSIDPDYQFDFWSIPGASNKVYALGDGSYQVAKHTPRREAAQRVLEFTTTRKFAELFAEHVNELPAYGKDMYIKPGVLKDMATNAAKKSYSVSLFNAYEINSGEPSYNSLVTQALKGILDKSKSPNQAAEHVQAGLNSWGYPGASKCM